MGQADKGRESHQEGFTGAKRRCYILNAFTATQLSLYQLSSPLHLNVPTNAITLLTTENDKVENKRIQNNEEKGGGKNKAITLQLGGANCSFNDKVLDDESDENGDDGENHEEEESALLVRQASSGSI